MRAAEILEKLTESDSALEYDLPDHGEGEWLTTSKLVDRWPEIVDRYQGYLQTKTADPAAACAAQHYAGRWIPVVLAFWWKSGRVPNLDRGIWLANIDARGATLSVQCSTPEFSDSQSVPELLDALVAHLQPLAEGSLLLSNLKEDVVWGSMAASLAGGLAMIVRSMPREARPEAARTAKQILRTESSLTKASDWLIEPNPVMATDGLRLSYLRTTCCLIHLGLSRCEQCPKRPAEEARSHSIEAAKSASRTVPNLTNDN